MNRRPGPDGGQRIGLNRCVHGRLSRPAAAFPDRPLLRHAAVFAIVIGLLCLLSSRTAQAYALTPDTWNVIGLDSNSPGAVDSNTTIVTDVVPANTIMCVSSACSNPPIAFTCSSTPPCGLTYGYDPR